MIYLKRGKWCVRDADGKLHKFDSEIAAKLAMSPATREETKDEEGAVLQYQSEEEEGYQSFEEEIDD